MQRAVQTSTARTPVLHAIEQFSGHCQRYAPGTRENYQTALARLIDYCRPKFIGDLNLPEINAYINSRLPGRKPQTLNKDINAIRSFSRWLSETYNIPNVAEKLRKMPVCNEESRFLTDEEYRKLLTVSSGRNLNLLKFLANTGLRASEVIALTPSSLQGSWLTVNGKGRKRRTIPLNKTALETVQNAIEFSKSRHLLYHICRQAAKRAGIAPFGPHALRHYCATQLLKSKPIHLVSKLLGHSSVTITEKIYWHFRHEDLAGLTDCLE